MHFMRIPLTAAALTAVTLASVHAMSPRVAERAQSSVNASVNVAQGERQSPAGFSKTELTGAPGVLDALADDNNMLVYVRVSQARYAAYYNDARSRCTMYRGKARATCVEEARVKYGQPLAGSPL